MYPNTGVGNNNWDEKCDARDWGRVCTKVNVWKDISPQWSEIFCNFSTADIRGCACLKNTGVLWKAYVVENENIYKKNKEMKILKWWWKISRMYCMKVSIIKNSVQNVPTLIKGVDRMDSYLC